MSTCESQAALGEGLVCGIFVGGASSRMGRPKGLLVAPGGGETLIARALRITGEALPGAFRLLVGRRAEYGAVDCAVLDDAQANAGPLAGLVALLEEGARQNARAVIALACDMPHFDAPLLQRLALEAPDAPLLVPEQAGRLQPFFARYSVALRGSCALALSSGERALQPVLRQLSPVLLPLRPEELALLRDWDRPEDVGQ